MTSLAERRERIEAVLDRIRPWLEADHMDITLTDVRPDGATVYLAGALCPGAPLNFQMGLEEVLREEIAEFGDLHLEVPTDFYT